MVENENEEDEEDEEEEEEEEDKDKDNEEDEEEKEEDEEMGRTTGTEDAEIYPRHTFEREDQSLECECKVGRASSLDPAGPVW